LRAASSASVALCSQKLLTHLDGTIEIQVVGDDSLDLWLYPPTSLDGLPAGKADGLFQHHHFTFPAFNPPAVSFRERPFTNGKRIRSWPAYTHRYEAINNCKDYEITVPASISDGVHDVLLELNYAGNTAALYSDGIIVADDYYYGRPMPVGVKRLGKRLTDAELILQLRPLWPKVRLGIFFEAGTDLSFVKEGRCELRSITPVPIRRIVLNP
jgi:hypothetical protein